MSEAHIWDTKKLFLQLDDPLQFRLSRIKEIEDFLIAETNDREKMNKTLNKCITVIDKTLFVFLLQAMKFFFFHLLLSLLSTASINLVFFISIMIAKMFLKTIRRKASKQNAISWMILKGIDQQNTAKGNIIMLLEMQKEHRV